MYIFTVYKFTSLHKYLLAMGSEQRRKKTEGTSKVRAILTYWVAGCEKNQYYLHLYTRHIFWEVRAKRNEYYVCRPRFRLYIWIPTSWCARESFQSSCVFTSRERVDGNYSQNLVRWRRMSGIFPRAEVASVSGRRARQRMARGRTGSPCPSINSFRGPLRTI